MKRRRNRTSSAQAMNHRLADIAQSFPGVPVALIIHGQCKGEGGPIVEWEHGSPSKMAIETSPGNVCVATENEAITRGVTRGRSYGESTAAHQRRRMSANNVSAGRSGRRRRTNGITWINQQLRRARKSGSRTELHAIANKLRENDPDAFPEDHAWANEIDAEASR